MQEVLLETVEISQNLTATPGFDTNEAMLARKIPRGAALLKQGLVQRHRVPLKG